MYLGLLQDFGLTRNEAIIYQTLLENGDLTVSKISSRSKIHRRNVYDVLQRLIEKKLVFAILAKGDNKYRPANPHRLVEIVKEKQNKLERILPELERQFKVKQAFQQVFIYHNLDGFSSYLSDMLRLKNDVYFVGKAKYWLVPELNDFLKSFIAEMKKLDIKYYAILETQPKEKDSWFLKEIKPFYKFLPRHYSTQTACLVFADRLVTLGGLERDELSSNVFIYMLVDKNIVDGYRQWFQFIWDKLPQPNSRHV